MPDASLFRSGRQLAAWLRLTPRANSSGGKERLGGKNKQGDGYLRRLLVVGATAILRMTPKNPARQPWRRVCSIVPMPDEADDRTATLVRSSSTTLRQKAQIDDREVQVHWAFQ